MVSGLLFLGKEVLNPQVCLVSPSVTSQACSQSSTHTGSHGIGAYAGKPHRLGGVLGLVGRIHRQGVSSILWVSSLMELWSSQQIASHLYPPSKSPPVLSNMLFAPSHEAQLSSLDRIREMGLWWCPAQLGNPGTHRLLFSPKGGDTGLAGLSSC